MFSARDTVINPTPASLATSCIRALGKRLTFRSQPVFGAPTGYQENPHKRKRRKNSRLTSTRPRFHPSPARRRDGRTDPRGAATGQRPAYFGQFCRTFHGSLGRLCPLGLIDGTGALGPHFRNVSNHPLGLWGHDDQFPGILPVRQMTLMFVFLLHQT